MNIVLTFTHKTSLRVWEESGLLSREINFYKKLSEKYGINFTFITYGDEYDLKFNEYFRNLRVFPLYKYVKESKFEILNYLKCISFINKIKSEIATTDLIKTNQLTGGWLGLILKLKLNKPLIVRTGFDKLSFHIKEKRSIFSILIIYIFTQICIFFSDVYFVTSETDKNFLKKFLVFSNKIKVRPNWVNINKEHSISNRNENILMVGRLEDQKNYDYVFESFKDSEFVIDIYGSGSKKKELKKLAFKNNLTVNFFGNVENKDLLNIYSKYKFLLVASKFEGNSKVILEGMGSGCIVFASNIPNNSEIIVNQINGYLFDFSDDLKSTVSNVQNQPEVHDSISKNALETIIDKYSMDKIVEEEYKTYSNVM